MKHNQLCKLTLPALLLGATMLSSCHTPLHRAAARGNIQAVREEIAYANSLSNEDKLDYLDGKPSNANLWWAIPACIFTVPVDLTLLMATGMDYALCTEEPTITGPGLTQLIADFWDTRAIEKSYENDYDDITYELMQAGARTPDYIDKWMRRNYRLYHTTPAASTPVEEKPGPRKKKTKEQETKGTSDSTPVRTNTDAPAGGEGGITL